MRSDLDTPFIEVIFPTLDRRRFSDDRFALDDVDGRLSVIDDLLFNFLTRCIDLFFADERWITVELTISEVACRGTSVIDNVEPELAVIITHARPAADDLFEFGHRTDHTSDNYVLTRWDIYACC